MAMPGPTATEFLERAEMEDVKVGRAEKDNPADVAKTGFEAILGGDGNVVAGWRNKLQSAAAQRHARLGSRRAASENGRARLGEGIEVSAMTDETRKPADDPVEGSREVVDDNLQEQARKQDREEKERDRQRPPSRPPREGKELGPKGIP